MKISPSLLPAKNTAAALGLGAPLEVTGTICGTSTVATCFTPGRPATVLAIPGSAAPCGPKAEKVISDGSVLGEELRERRLRAAGARDRAECDPAGQADQQHDRDVAAEPAPDRRGTGTTRRARLSSQADPDPAHSRILTRGGRGAKVSSLPTPVVLPPPGRLLGAQLLGHRNAEVAKRVDVYAAALFHEMTIEAFSELDLSYTPPLGSPWDVVQMAAQSWEREHRAAAAE